MARPSVIGLKAKGSSKENFTAKIDSDLIEEFKELESQVEKETDWTLSRSDIIEEALRENIKAVRAELAKVRKAKSEGKGETAGA